MSDETLTSSKPPARKPRKKLSRNLLLKKMPMLNLPRYLRQKKEWLEKGGKITRRYRILTDYADTAGAAKGHYSH
ncbi:MAG: hypothetical protein ACI9US_003901, partial [Gammaproteobacteria bacterium]